MKTSNNEQVKENINEIDINKKDLNRVFWRSFQMEFSWNYERQMNLAYTYAMIPILKKLYKKKEDLSESLKRHLEFFNTTPHIVTLMLGVSTAMEKQNAVDPNFDSSTINSVKASLMGPLAGLGDSLYWGTLRLIATGIGTSLALQGNILGPILFLLIFNIPHIVLRFIFTRLGFKMGTGFLQNLQKKGTMESLTFGAAILGLMVIGGMSASMITLEVPLKIGSGENATKVQDILNNIMPGLLPLGAFGIMYWLLGKGVKATSILLGIALVGICGVWIGVFG
ncbi:PTS mannose transporter subunit IID [Priestia filamentosa]|uniref:PTS mannose transporter subunit IID n=2 Tax=Priestia filamentosa TaxID=1402861 RepID=A0A0H4KRT5_9BACI|nr:PTS system mannose/fructose/sorbose family transporter subunit IID [Priestia filamentosa]AKO95139.1 PTS mannose transporter subunit IID [Priestia filamentosa]MDT3763780.1 PTS system mannose/fructose/sorbose family transporter subunit IID [Priestia filamentosa]OXS72138.1 PTS mannose transporter subunit IID [Priestia filamentosa]WRU97627.1 PTS system mannose/fructose/sorbose family transporter subunit IID [Priestia filamentosa]